MAIFQPQLFAPSQSRGSDLKRPAPITRAQIERALKAGKAQGMAAIEIEAGGVKLRYSLGENSGDKPKAQVAKPRSML